MITFKIVNSKYIHLKLIAVKNKGVINFHSYFPSEDLTQDLSVIFFKRSIFHRKYYLANSVPHPTSIRDSNISQMNEGHGADIGWELIRV